MSDGINLIYCSVTADCGGDYMLVRLVPAEESLYTVVRQSNRWSVTITLEVIDTIIDTIEEATE
jgi:hypothetical protein